jgi:hypothetical protein
MIKTLSLTLICFLCSMASFAQDKRHFKMKSLEGVVIDLNYQIKRQAAPNCMKCSLYTNASPLTVSIIHKDLKDSDQVRIVFINYKTSSWGNSEETKTYDLNYTSTGTFSTQTDNFPIYSSGYTGTEYYHQELAVVINGQWLKARENNSNFSFKLHF